MTTAPDLSMFSKEEIKDVLSEIRHDFSLAVIGADNYFNSAAIIRSAHQFLAREIILVDCPKIYGKATMGSLKWENISHVSLEQFIAGNLPHRNLVICERRPELPSENLIYFKFPENPILCFGSEKTGVPEQLILAAREARKNNNPNTGSVVSIPQFGLQNDFNLACAAGVVMYDWIAKKYALKGGGQT